MTFIQSRPFWAQMGSTTEHFCRKARTMVVWGWGEHSYDYYRFERDWRPFHETKALHVRMTNHLRLLRYFLKNKQGVWAPPGHLELLPTPGTKGRLCSCFLLILREAETHPGAPRRILGPGCRPPRPGGEGGAGPAAGQPRGRGEAPAGFQTSCPEPPTDRTWLLGTGTWYRGDELPPDKLKQ